MGSLPTGRSASFPEANNEGYLLRERCCKNQIFLRWMSPFRGLISQRKNRSSRLAASKTSGKNSAGGPSRSADSRGMLDWVLLLNRRLIACGPVPEVFTREILAKTLEKGRRF
jgi:hypothetical protein